VKRRFLLDIVVRKGPAIFKLLSGKDKTLLIRGDTLLVLNLRFHIIDGIGRLNLEGDSLASEGLDEDLHSTTETENQMEGGLLLNVVVRERTAVLELLASEDQALLIRGNTLLVLDLILDVIDGVRRFNLKGDGLSREGLDDY